MYICNVSKDNFEEWLSMGYALWPESEWNELIKEFRDELESGERRSFLAQNDAGEYVGFVSLSLRSDYVEGTVTSPVGYIEGLYVKPEFRNKGVARELVNYAVLWAKKQGCIELGSDTELSNADSQKFHERIGFKKMNTIVHYLLKF